jgi:ABC-type phosphate transport system substrate-binding protein
MPRRRHILLIALLGLGVARARAEDGAFQVIVNPANPVAAVSRDFLRDAYLRKATDWENGATIHPIDLAPRFPERARFTHEVLRKSHAQLRSYWNQQIFSGKGVPPAEAESTAAAIAYVLAHPGAVGYLPAGIDPGGAKIVQVH